MTFPAKVKVGYRDYAIVPWAPIDASAADRYGECDRMRSIIRIRSDLGPQHFAEVLLHEVGHAVYEMGDLDSGSEEKIVTVMAKQMCQVWRDNPELVEFLSQSLRG